MALCTANSTSPRGVALITALLVVAVTSVAMVGMTSRLMVELRRTENILYSEQAEALLSGIERWGVGQLARDLETAAGVDYGGEDWARPLPPTELENGLAAGRIEDLQARFDVNGLVRDGNVDPVALPRFRRLLRRLELPEELIPPLLDWMDADQDIRYPNGAEDDHYSRLEPPYRTADRPLVSVSELRLVAGFDDAVYRALRPHVTALPVPAAINVNTAGVEVLMMLADDLAPPELEALVKARREQPFATLDEFLTHPAFAGRELAGAGLAVNSSNFVIHGTVTMGRARSRLTALVTREAPSTVRVRYRHHGGDSQ